MALEHKLEMRLLQKLILTPQLQQAIKLLQMPYLELSQTLSQELTENPFLEETIEETIEEPLAKEPTNEIKETETYEETDDTEVPLEKMMRSSINDYFEERGLDGRDLGYFTPDYVLNPSIEQTATSTASLYDHLMWQLRFSSASETIKETGEAVIGNIDDNGYLRATLDDIINCTGCSPEDAIKAVKLIQTFDPPGVGARDIRECLLIQLKSLSLQGGIVEDIIRHNLEDLEKRRYKQIAGRYGCTINELMKIIKVIESLEPKPGRNFSSEPPLHIVPDVYVIKTAEGYQITLNDEHIPGLRINKYYRQLLLKKNTLPAEERQYLEEKLRSAVWFLRSLDHRNKTIYRVTESILNFQRAFFDGDISRMKPMNLKDIAGDLGMHESTISRATSNKYLSCSHGIFNFKYFFSSGINSDSGKVSSTSVKELIRTIISGEDPGKPLSDQKIVEMLKGQNIKVARRTVAKYRDEMNLAPQIQRKKIDYTKEDT